MQATETTACINIDCPTAAPTYNNSPPLAIGISGAGVRASACASVCGLAEGRGFHGYQRVTVMEVTGPWWSKAALRKQGLLARSGRGRVAEEQLSVAAIEPLCQESEPRTKLQQIKGS